MAHSYRTLHAFDNWLTSHFLGSAILEEEKLRILSEIEHSYSKHAVLIGTPAQINLLKATGGHHQSLITTQIGACSSVNVIESSLTDIPILTGSVDVVVMPHTLDFIDTPRQLLSEACRIIKPEGLMVVFCFNPYSSWGAHKLVKHKNGYFPAGAEFLPATVIKNWLELADFVIEKHVSMFYRPPVESKALFDRLRIVERIGGLCLPRHGAVSMLVARAKVVPLTPIRMKWKQRLGGIRISSTVTGNLARRSPASVSEKQID